MKILFADDLQRAHAVIRYLRLKGPHDGSDAFTWPARDTHLRRELADVVYDLSDRHAARAVLDAPNKMRTVIQQQQYSESTDPKEAPDDDQ